MMPTNTSLSLSCKHLNTWPFPFSTSLSRPANTLYRHNLTATLESAISSSNAQNDPPDVLRRLDARMLEYSHGEIGWDVFTLEYRIDPPIDTVITPESMINYMKIFSHIWKMRRVESSLAKGWMRIAGGARTFLRLPGACNDVFNLILSRSVDCHRA
jgi:gamma-tubulin complex component 3